MRLPDVNNRRLLGLKYELVCCSELMVDMVGGGLREFMKDAVRPAFLERELMGFGVDGYW